MMSETIDESVHIDAAHLCALHVCQGAFTASAALESRFSITW